MISADQSAVNNNSDRQVMTRAEAKALDLKHYFTGVPCKQGHVAERYVAAGCGCCECKRQYSENNRERERERARLWREKDTERAREANREGVRRYNKTEKARAKQRRFAKKHPEKARENMRQWRQNNPEKARAGDFRWKKNNPDKLRAIKHRARAKRLGANGTHTSTDVADIRKLQRNRCARCRESLKGKKAHIDHIIALARGGSNDRKNIQILCASCNISKNARDPLDDMRRLGRLL